MVNKQYNVQSLNKKSKRNQSPPPNRSVTIISSYPSPQQSAYNINSNLNRLSTDILSSAQQQQAANHASSAFDRSFTYRHDDFDVVDSADEISKCGSYSSANEQLATHPQSDLSINDIGRFQYILQMDREMVSVCVITSLPTSLHNNIIIEQFRVLCTAHCHSSHKL